MSESLTVNSRWREIRDSVWRGSDRLLRIHPESTPNPPRNYLPKRVSRDFGAGGKGGATGSNFNIVDISHHLYPF